MNKRFDDIFYQIIENYLFSGRNIDSMKFNQYSNYLDLTINFWFARHHL